MKMILDMAPMLRGEIKCLDFDYSLTPETLDGVTFLSDAHVMGQITNNGYMQLSRKRTRPSLGCSCPLF